MYKLCKTEQSASRQHQLENGLLAAMGTQRYEEISVSDLCEQMQIPRKSFYRYFSSKDGALHAMLDHTLLEYHERQAQRVIRDSLHETRAELEIFFSFWLGKKTLLDALERSGLSGILVERAISQAGTEFHYLSPARRDDPEAVRDHAASFVITGLMSMVIKWHHLGYRQSVSEMAQIASSLLTRPLIMPGEQLL